MSRYGDLDELIEAFHRLTLGENSLIERLFADGVYAVIDTFPTADVVPVVHAHWIKVGNPVRALGRKFTCSACNERTKVRTNFCASCGAKMDEEVEE